MQQINDTTRKWSKPPIKQVYDRTGVRFGRLVALSQAERTKVNAVEQHNWTTKVFARSAREAFGMSPEDAQAIFCYRRPLYERILIWLLFRFGWALVLLAAFLLSGCIGPDDADTAILIAQDLQEAVQQARGE